MKTATKRKPQQKPQSTTAFEKVEKYITKVAEEYGATIEKGQRSRYFKFNGRVLRLSNHIGKNSSGAISIIVPYGTTQKDDVFILHVHSTGNLQTINFAQLKEFVRTFALVSDFLEPLVNSTTVAYVQNNYQKDKENTILGYPESSFSDAQINQIRLFIGQNHQEHVPKNRK